MEVLPDVNARLRHHSRQLLPQLELLSHAHHSAKVFPGRFSLRNSQGKRQRTAIKRSVADGGFTCGTRLRCWLVGGSLLVGSLMGR